MVRFIDLAFVRYVVHLTFIVLVCYSQVFAEFQASDEKLPEDLTTVGLEELLNFDISVTSASKKKQKLSEVSSAVSIVTNEDIRRIGATHVAEALRLVPGVSVARITSSIWAVTVRGFNQPFVNKLLVMVDGRSVFTPMFSGTYWEIQHIPLHDVDRIEVVRGPGAAVWGSNATNGVINIITKNAADTQGGIASIGGGNEESVLAYSRYGGRLGEDSFYRIFGQFNKRDSNVFQDGGDAKDDWRIASGGFRIDTGGDSDSKFHIMGDVYQEREEREATAPSLSPPYIDTESFSGRVKSRGGSMNVKWEKELSESSELQLAADYYYEDRKNELIPNQRHTAHFEFQHRFAPFERHDLMYGLEYRINADDIEGTFADDFQPPSRTTHLYTGFINDEIELIRDKLNLILGSKFEHNSHTGFEFMPNIRTILTIDDRQSVWAAVSRSVTLPSRALDDMIVPLQAYPDEASGLTALITATGDRSVEAENLLAYEAGYRAQVTQDAFLDLAVFYNDYDDENSLEPGMPYVGVLRDQTVPALIIPLLSSNELSARTYGVEVGLDWQVQEWFRLLLSYSYIDIAFQQGQSQDAANIDIKGGSTPENQFQITSMLDFSESLSFNSTLRYIDRVSYGDIDNYFELDARIGWELSESIVLSLVGRNLLDDQHVEGLGSFFAPPLTEIERSVFAKLDYSF